MPPAPVDSILKAALVERARGLMADGFSLRQAAAELQLQGGTLHKWMSAPASTPQGKRGRPARFELTEEEEAALRWHVLKKDSLPIAAEDFIKSEQCRPETRAALQDIMDSAARARRRPAWPVSFRRAARVTPEMRANFRGKKATQNFELVNRRGHSIILETGEEVTLAPGMLWESDDMSSNEPFRYIDPSTGEWATGRQTLCTLDVYSAAWLGNSPVGRDRDAYRAEDIADHMLALVQAWGMPLFWRLERGAWENTFIDGVPLDGAEAVRYGLSPERFRGKVWGSLNDLFRVVRTWSSRGKGTVEVGFDLLQTIMAHESLSIGRKRGEFENATRDVRLADKGDANSLAKIWTMEEYSNAMAEGMLRANQRPKERRIFGKGMVVPEELFAKRQTRECPESDIWRLGMTVKKFATIRQGRIETTVKHWKQNFAFQVNGVSDIYFPHGFRCLIAFHPGHPERGCVIANAEVGARNRGNWTVGQVLMTAPMMGDAPQIDLSGGFSGGKKAANAAMRSEFRQVAAAGMREPARVSLGRDGLGQTMAYQRGIAPVDGPAAHQPQKVSRGDVNENDFANSREPEAVKLPPRQTQPVDLEALEARFLEREGMFFP